MFYDFKIKLLASEVRYFNFLFRNNNASSDALFTVNISLLKRELIVSFRHIFWIKDFEVKLLK